MTIDELNDFMQDHGFCNVYNTDPIKKEYVADLVGDALTEAYNKAIDDFVKALEEKYACCGYIEELAEIDIEEIAEQLKAGGEEC